MFSTWASVESTAKYQNGGDAQPPSGDKAASAGCQIKQPAQNTQPESNAAKSQAAEGFVDPDVDGLSQLKQFFTGDTSTLAFALALIGIMEEPDAGNNKDVMRRVLESALTDWVAVTHRVMDYREIESLNDYIADVQFQEDRRLTNTKNSMTSNMLVAKQMYLMQNRASAGLLSHIRMLMYSMLFVCLMAVLLPHAADSNAVKAGMFLLLCAYAVMMIIYFKINSTRRMDDWEKMYWRSGELDYSKTSADTILQASASSDTCGAGAASVPLSMS